MEDDHGQKIICPYCRQQSAVKIVKQYDGFTPVGEIKTCAFCGHVLEEEDLAYIRDAIPEGLRPAGERRSCYLCEHYVVNPFLQKCVLHDREVEALDSCPEFSPKPHPPPEKPRKTKPPSIF